MKQTKVFGILTKLIFPVFFTALFFIIAGFDHVASVWIAYGMIMATYALWVLTPLFARVEKTALETTAPVFVLAGANFLLHLVLGIIFMLIAAETYKWEIIVYLILIAIFLVPFFMLMFANSHTDASAKRQAKEVFFIKNQASKLKMLMGRIADSELDRALENVADNMHSSPSRSGGVAAQVEASITMKVMEIEMAINEARADDAKRGCRELTYLIEERTRVLKLNY